LWQSDKDGAVFSILHDTKVPRAKFAHCDLNSRELQYGASSKWTDAAAGEGIGDGNDGVLAALMRDSNKLWLVLMLC
jgi:hypothetical protein